MRKTFQPKSCQVKERRTPFLFVRPSSIKSFHGSRSLVSTDWNVCSIRIVIYDAIVIARLSEYDGQHWYYLYQRGKVHVTRTPWAHPGSGLKRDISDGISFDVLPSLWVKLISVLSKDLYPPVTWPRAPWHYLASSNKYTRLPILTATSRQPGVPIGNLRIEWYTWYESHNSNIQS